jgi:hypothetical protein
MRRPLIALAALLCAATLAPAGSAAATPRARGHGGCALPKFGAGANYHPDIHPAQFSPHVTNPLFPLPPGVTFVYEGVDSGRPAIDVFAPSRHTKVINGVRARVVHDQVYIRNVLRERTSDYYAQDRCGNVWYFGENTAELDTHGNVTSREGSWRYGRHGGKPGVFMQAHPQLDRRFRQEWSSGVAEDQFKAISRGKPVTVPYAHFAHALRTRETTVLEPGVVDRKVYARGIGEVVERSVKGGHDLLELVAVLR